MGCQRAIAQQIVEQGGDYVLALKANHADLLRARYRDRAALATTLTSHFPGQRQLVIGEIDISRLPVMVTEYGGVSYAPGASDEWYGYGQVRTAEEFLETYRRLTAALASSALLSGFCYTQLTDTLQETNGLLRDDRTPKIDITRIADATRGS